MGQSRDNFSFLFHVFLFVDVKQKPVVPYENVVIGQTLCKQFALNEHIKPNDLTSSFVTTPTPVASLDTSVYVIKIGDIQYNYPSYCYASQLEYTIMRLWQQIFLKALDIY